MAQAALRHIVLGLATTGLLMGCVEGAGSGSGTNTAAAITAPGRTGEARDVEAPEVFQVTDSALWDGRPSLGGIWVASPDAKDPERVIMVNQTTGKSVQGALFRRERENPGPRLQISSDAAEALGILAGQPVEIRVTALRRSEPAKAAPPEEAAPEDAVTATEDAAPQAPATDGDAAATAAAATAALAATGAAATEAAESGAEAVVADAPKRKTWKERRAEAKAAREAKKAAADAAKAAEAAGETVEAGAEVAATPEAAGVAVIETAPLDARAPEATEATDKAAAEAAAVAEPPKTRRQLRAEAAAAAAAAEAAATAATETPATDTPAAGRQIQIASFSKEENANRAVQALAKAGITAQTRKSETGGKIVWGVVATGDAELLKSIQAAGFADAFFLQ